MMIGSFGLGISMMMLSILLSFSRPQYSESLQHATSSASVAFLFTYMLFFGSVHFMFSCSGVLYLADSRTERL